MFFSLIASDNGVTDERGEACTPVMIHRAMLGSLERMFALLIEHTAGKVEWVMRILLTGGHVDVLHIYDAFNSN